MNVELGLVGRVINPEFATSVRELAHEQGVEPHVRFVGELEDVNAHLRDIDIVIAPSRDEWTPLSLMEAMAIEKPVVAAAVGGVNDLIDDGRTGSLVPPEDADRLADAIADLVADPERASRMALQGRREISAKFSIRHTLEGAEREIRHVIDER